MLKLIFYKHCRIDVFFLCLFWGFLFFFFFGMEIKKLMHKSNQTDPLKNVKCSEFPLGQGYKKLFSSSNIDIEYFRLYPQTFEATDCCYQFFLVIFKALKMRQTKYIIQHTKKVYVQALVSLTIHGS